MNYSTHLIPGYSSWQEFYEHIKPHIGQYDEDVYWEECTTPPILIHHVRTVPDKFVVAKKHKYSVRFVQQQVINELTKQVKLQTFDTHDLKGLLIALESWGLMGRGTHTDRLRDKVSQLLEVEYIHGRR